MCGRYVFDPDKGWVNQATEQKRSSFEPNYNVAPMQTMPIITADGIELMRWGLVPSWSKEFKPSFLSINARAETAAEKPLYRSPFKKRRCLVPASGFYEWQQLKGFKQPFLFTVKDRPMFNFAGLYDVWCDEDEQPHKTYTILTTAANGVMSDVHDRMPVILEPDEEKLWLDESEEPNTLQLLLDPLPDTETMRHEVGREVGNVKNNSKDLLLPLKSA